MQADDKRTPQQKQQAVSTANKSQRSVPDGWLFRKAKDTVDHKVKIDVDEKPIKINVDLFAEEYNMKHKRRGVAIILNNVHFKDMSTRHGSTKDSVDLKESLIRLGFEVRVFIDRDMKTINTVLESTAAEDHTDADCLIVIAMSHGESGLLYSSDGLYPVETLWTPFTGNRCTSLAGKPKLFFIQACRGDELDKGVKISLHETDSMSSNTYSIPIYADIMIAYATYDDYNATRARSLFLTSILNNRIATIVVKSTLLFLYCRTLNSTKSYRF
ncbi:caspase-1-like isoform X3 [Pogonomyrmex barbatus]|uniref:Caspase-1-like isoform X3 n=1 Tax=Pogonomyrmex barbatus TaxID=144034 RepID=A0A6I9VR32_9HYME|nr:caspase-1-like isoform X3 [Pogonomyrmex barbatus]